MHPYIGNEKEVLVFDDSRREDKGKTHYRRHDALLHSISSKVLITDSSNLYCIGMSV